MTVTTIKKRPGRVSQQYRKAAQLFNHSIRKSLSAQSKFIQKYQIKPSSPSGSVIISWEQAGENINQAIIRFENEQKIEKK